jgi:hypothetical protein
MNKIENPEAVYTLKEMVWARAFENTDVVRDDHYYREITKDIHKRISPENYGRPGFHWHTVRNFYEDKTKPTILTLELFATYALDAEGTISWRSFLNQEATERTLNPAPFHPESPGGRWKIRVVVEVPIIIEIEDSRAIISLDTDQVEH